MVTFLFTDIEGSTALLQRVGEGVYAGVLASGGSRTAAERQQTLRATVDWSYGLLTSAEQGLLRRLSVFADSFDLNAAEAVCGIVGIAAADIADLLGSLVDKSLVLTQPAGEALRYRLLENIRQFAAERLAEAEWTYATTRSPPGMLIRAPPCATRACTPEP